MTKEEKKMLRRAYWKLNFIVFGLICVIGSLIYTAFFFEERSDGVITDLNAFLAESEETTDNSDENNYWYVNHPDPEADSVLITWYNPCESQCDSDPFITADMSKIDIKKLNNRDIRWIAVSRDLLEKYSMGDTIIIESPNSKINGEWVIHDKMNKRFEKRIDLLVSEKDDYYNLKMPKKATIKKV